METVWVLFVGQRRCDFVVLVGPGGEVDFAKEVGGLCKQKTITWPTTYSLTLRTDNKQQAATQAAPGRSKAAHVAE